MLLALTRRIAGTFRRAPVRHPRTGPWTLLRLEDRAVPAVAYAVGAGAGGGPQVNVYDENNALILAFNAYATSFRGGVRVATADVNNDGTLDVVTAPGNGGGPHIRVFDGAALPGIVRPLTEFLAYGGVIPGGVYVAAGDIDADGFADIITGAGAGGGPHVKAFSGFDGTELLSFNAYDPSFTGGVRVGSADFGGDNGGSPSKTAGDHEIVTGPGPGGGPHVRLWDFDDQIFEPDNFSNFNAFSPAFTGGIFVSGGYLTNNIDSDGFFYPDIIVSADAGGGPHVTTWRLDAFVDAPARDVAVYVAANVKVDASDPAPVDPSDPVASFFPYAVAFTGGSRVAVIQDINGDGFDDIVTGPGAGGGPHVRVLNGDNLASLAEFLAFGTFAGGVFVG
jgi:hypothetical protein